MNSRDPLEIELLIPTHLRTCSVAHHQAFRDSMVQPKPLDPIDELVEELRQLHPDSDINAL